MLKSRYSRMWRRIVWWTGTNVLEDPTAFVFREYIFTELHAVYCYQHVKFPKTDLDFEYKATKAQSGETFLFRLGIQKPCSVLFQNWHFSRKINIIMIIIGKPNSLLRGCCTILTTYNKTIRNQQTANGNTFTVFRFNVTCQLIDTSHLFCRLIFPP
jgi:hypothetical protein